MPASDAQLDYIESLARQARHPVDLKAIRTPQDASETIDLLHRRIPISDKTRAAVFATLKDSEWTKEDMYLATGVETLGKGATEYDGKACLKFLNTGITETRRFTVEQAAETLLQTNTPQLRRPMGRPMAPKPQQAPTVTEPPKEPVRRPMRPPAYKPPVQTAPDDAIPGLDVDPQTGDTTPFAAAPAQGLTPEQIDQVTEGVTLESAASVLSMLRAKGVVIPKIGMMDRWGIYDTERSLLGLMPESPVFFGSVTNQRANSGYYSRNRKYEEIRCAPPF